MSDEAFTTWLGKRELPMIGDRISLPRLQNEIRAGWDAGRSSVTPSREQLANAIGVAVTEGYGSGSQDTFLAAADAVLALFHHTIAANNKQEAGE